MTYYRLLYHDGTTSCKTYYYGITSKFADFMNPCKEVLAILKITER